jgi:vacuolar-type H+-ATPase subunit H
MTDDRDERGNLSSDTSQTLTTARRDENPASTSGRAHDPESHPEYRPSPLLLIKNKEIEVATLIEATRREADVYIEQARKKAAEILAEAEKKGLELAAALKEEELAKAREQAKAIIAAAEAQAVELKKLAGTKATVLADRILKELL